MGPRGGPGRGVFRIMSLRGRAVWNAGCEGIPVAMPQNVSEAYPAEQDARRCPRQRVSWLVTVGAGPRLFQGRTRDISASGAKILLKERPALGTQVSLRFRPPGRPSVQTRAIVWRVDTEGLACMFVGMQTADFLATVTPPRPVVGAPPAAARRRVGTVLVAIMDAGMRTQALEALRRAGHTVLDPGPQPLVALRVAEEHRNAIHVVLVDADLKLMNGAPLVERLASLLPSAAILRISSGAALGRPDLAAVSLPAHCTELELVARVEALLHPGPGRGPGPASSRPA